MGPYSAFIFDFDGVLGRTHEDSCRAWSEACRAFGVLFDEEEFLLAEGKRSVEFITHALTKQGKPLELAHELISLKDSLYRSQNRFAFYDGAPELMARLKAEGYRVAVVSGGSRARLQSGLAKELLGSCDVVITGDDLRRGKPSPEAYLRAAAELGASPKECLVIENAPLGIQSAKAAGMPCVALSTTLSIKHLTQADMVLEDLDELVSILERHGLLYALQQVVS
jgi:beta-phosphoglucomutase